MSEVGDWKVCQQFSDINNRLGLSQVFHEIAKRNKHYPRLGV